MKVKLYHREKQFLICLLFFFFLGSVPSKVSASDEQTTGSGAEKFAAFTIKPRLPENQMDAHIRYFYLHVQPNQEQELEIEVINRSNQAELYTVALHSAGTNANGLLTYEEGNELVESNEAVSIQQLVTVETKELKVEPGTVGIAKLKLKIPNHALKGLVLGGISIRPKLKEEEQGSGMSVGNTYGYVSGIALKSDKDYLNQGLEAIELYNVEPVIDAGKKLLTASLLNPLPQVFGEFSISGKLIDLGNNETITERTMEECRIAPHTLFPFQLDWGMEEVRAGKYRFEAIVTGKEETSKKWEFSREFEISSKKANEMNEDTSFKLIVPQWFILCFCILALLTITLLAGLVVRSNRQKKKFKKRKKKKE